MLTGLARSCDVTGDEAIGSYRVPISEVAVGPAPKLMKASWFFSLLRFYRVPYVYPLRDYVGPLIPSFLPKNQPEGSPRWWCRGGALDGYWQFYLRRVARIFCGWNPSRGTLLGGGGGGVLPITRTVLFLGTLRTALCGEAPVCHIVALGPSISRFGTWTLRDCP